MRRDVDVEVDGKRFKVALWVPDVPDRRRGRRRGAAGRRRAAPGPGEQRAPGAAAIAGSGKVTVPMQGTIVKVLVEVGAGGDGRPAPRRARGDEDGEQRRADKDGTVAEVKVAPGQAVASGDIVVIIE